MDSWSLEYLPDLEHFWNLGYWVAFIAAFLETALLIGLFAPVPVCC